MSPDAKRLVSASADRTVKVWDTGTGAEIQTLTTQGSQVQSVAFSPDGQWIVGASNNHKMGEIGRAHV